jgi:saccharopepsin
VVLIYFAIHLSKYIHLRLKVDKQALLDVNAANDPVLGYGLDGICGLGFDGLSSIDYGVNKTSSDSGRSLLYNLFAVNPEEPNFIAFSLLRSTAGNDDSEGSFSIGMTFVWTFPLLAEQFFF